jgi:hypothetical protein
VLRSAANGLWRSPGSVRPVSGPPS